MAFGASQGPAGPPGADGLVRMEEFEITAGRLSAKTITLSAVPVTDNVLVIIQGAPNQYRDIDFTVSGNNVQRGGYGLDGELSLGDWVTIVY